MSEKISHVSSARDMPRIGLLLPDLRGGGAERVGLNLANEFAQRGFAVDLVLMRAEGQLLPHLDKRIRVVDLGASRVRNVLLALVSYLRRARPAGLIAHMWPLTVIAPLAILMSRVRIRVIGVEHTTWSASRRGCERGFMRRFRMSTWVGYRLSDGVVAVSTGAADDLAELARLARHRVIVIHNPIVCDPFGGTIRLDDPAPVAWSTGPHHKVLAVGTLKAIKDFPMLLRAFASVRNQVDARLLILGEGEQRPQLEALVQDLGLTGVVFMPGFSVDPTPYFARADLHVLSSRSEGLGNVIIEALEQGTPVVSTDCRSGPREILRDGRYGTLVPVGDQEALASAMLKSLAKSHDPTALRARAQDFRVDKSADAYLDLLLPHWPVRAPK